MKHQKISQIREDLSEYPIFSQCQFHLGEKGLFVHCPPAKVVEIHRCRHVILDCAMRHEIAGFVIFLAGDERYASTKITSENLWALRRFSLEMLYRDENHFRK
jgi:hypothetical protein